MRRDQFANFIEWWAVNEFEYRALTDAQDGNPEALAKLVKEKGELNTLEARSWVAARLRGEKLPRGLKRTVAQQAKELGLLGMMLDIQREQNCSEYKAREYLLRQFPEIESETLKTYIRRAKKTFKAISGRDVSKVQKSSVSEP